MKLFTKKQYEQLTKNGSDENFGKDHLPVVKLFLTGSGCTWLITELNPENPEIAFGLCDLGMGFPELGYVSLSELKEAQGVLRFLERDLWFDGKYPISVYAKLASQLERIETDDDEALSRILNK